MEIPYRISWYVCMYVCTYVLHCRIMAVRLVPWIPDSLSTFTNWTWASHLRLESRSFRYGIDLSNISSLLFFPSQDKSVGLKGKFSLDKKQQEYATFPTVSSGSTPTVSVLCCEGREKVAHDGGLMLLLSVPATYSSQ